MSINANDLLQSSIVYQQQGVKWNNTLHWRATTDVSNDDEVQELTSLTEDIAEAFAQVMHEAAIVLGIIWTMPLRATFGSRTLIVNEPGAISGDLSQTTQYFIIRKYGDGSGSANRGRVLVAGFPEQWSEDNRLTASAVVVAADLVTFLKSSLNGPLGSYSPSIYSPTLETAVSVFKTNLDPIVRSFHGRQARLI